ncbi:MAG: hypothetical protein LUI05_05000 [Oscillospiraceae bacterium]|nr:hypothetical protein [Oscillospiraceae bacterium]
MSGLKKLISLASAAALTFSMCAVSASATEAYNPYNYDRWGDPIASQAGYTADYFVSGDDIGVGSLSEPADLFVSYDDLMYIVDKGNNRIIVTDMDFNLVREMKDFTYEGEATTLKKPTGIFVDQYTGAIYIADNENERVIKCDEEGNISKIYGRPDTELYSSDLTYNPNKVIVDKAGNVYVVVKSVTKGAVMFDSDGDFIGYYGANRVEQTAEVIANAFWNLISTEEQRSRTTKSTPIGFTNFDIDDMGFIYTVTESTETTTDLVKKLNPEGNNILDSLGVDNDFQFGDTSPTYYSIYAKNSSLTDIDIGPNGELNILDFQHGRIFQYDKEAWLLFIMGGTGEQLGTFRSATAIESYDNKLFVLDSRKNTVTVFTRTAFGEIVTEASNLYNDGKYEESLEPWLSVLKYDGNYRRAYIGIGNALFNRGDYREAMDYFEISISRSRYDRAYEGYRNEWIKAHFTLIIVVIIVLIVLLIVYGQLKKRGKLKFLRKGGA